MRSTNLLFKNLLDTEEDMIKTTRFKSFEKVALVELCDNIPISGVEHAIISPKRLNLEPER